METNKRSWLYEELVSAKEVRPSDSASPTDLKSNVFDSQALNSCCIAD